MDNNYFCINKTEKIMKRFLSLIAVVTMVFSISCAQRAESGEQKFSTGPHIKFEKIEHDYGKVPHGGNGAYEFQFENTGDAPLVLSNVRSSCGCTVPSYPKGQPIKPGEKAAIKVKYDTKRMGAFAKNITVYSNADESPIVLKIKGTIIKKVANETTAAN